MEDNWVKRLKKKVKDFMSPGKLRVDRLTVPLKPSQKRLTSDIAASLLKEAGGDPKKARKLSRARGYDVW